VIYYRSYFSWYSQAYLLTCPLQRQRREGVQPPEYRGIPIRIDSNW